MTFSSHLSSGLLSGLIFLSLLFMAAGGLGMAASVGLIGLLLWPAYARSELNAIRRAPLVALLTALTLGWFCLSFAWSPHPKPDQLYKLALLSPLFMGAGYLAWRLTAHERAHQLHWISLLMALAGSFFLFEAVSNAWISSWIELNLEEATSLSHARTNAKVTLSRGATVFLMLTGPLALWLWRSGQRHYLFLAGFLAGTSFAAAISFDVEANVVALFAATIAAGLAFKWPRRTLQSLLIGSAIWILGAPLWMSLALSVFPESWTEALPFSWAWRLEIWGAAIEKIKEMPITGHGLSAMRSFDQLIELRGSQIDIFPPHAHNAGLQIWIETGAIGAFLTALALLALADKLTRARMTHDQALGFAYVGTVWIVTVTIGYGLWQEWHHGALALALFTARLTAYGKPV